MKAARVLRFSKPEDYVALNHGRGDAPLPNSTAGVLFDAEPLAYGSLAPPRNLQYRRTA